MLPQSSAGTSGDHAKKCFHAALSSRLTRVSNSQKEERLNVKTQNHPAFGMPQERLTAIRTAKGTECGRRKSWRAVLAPSPLAG